MATENIANLTFLGNGIPAVTSLKLAESFGISHKNVMRDIRALFAKLPKSFTELNFEPMSTAVSIGNGATRQSPAYLLTRDAFTLLAMGYNSPRAIQWKLKYIEAFNALETAVFTASRQAALREGAALAAELGPVGRRRMRRAIAYRAKGLSLADIATLLDVHGREVSHLLKAANTLGLTPASLALPAGGAA